MDGLSVRVRPVAKRLSRAEAVEEGWASASATRWKLSPGRMITGQNDIQTAPIESRREVDALWGGLPSLHAGLTELLKESETGNQNTPTDGGCGCFQIDMNQLPDGRERLCWQGRIVLSSGGETQITAAVVDPAKRVSRDRGD
jgi:hypothetical protein